MHVVGHQHGNIFARDEGLESLRGLKVTELYQHLMYEIRQVSEKRHRSWSYSTRGSGAKNQFYCLKIDDEGFVHMNEYCEKLESGSEATKLLASIATVKCCTTARQI